MKLLLPVEVFYPSQAGGPANSVYWLTKNLVKEGFEPVVVSSDKGIAPGFDLNTWKHTDGGKVIHVKTASFTFPVRQTLQSLSSLPGVDIVHLSSLFYPAAFLTAFAARLLKKKLSGRSAVNSTHPH